MFGFESTAPATALHSSSVRTVLGRSLFLSWMLPIVKREAGSDAVLSALLPFMVLEPSLHCDDRFRFVIPTGTQCALFNGESRGHRSLKLLIVFMTTFLEKSIKININDS